MLVASYAADHSEPDAEFRFIIDTIRAVQAAVQAAVLAQHWQKSVLQRLRIRRPKACAFVTRSSRERIDSRGSEPPGFCVMNASVATAPAAPTRLQRALDWIERVGNKLPDPALLFVLLLVLVALLSWALSGVTWAVIDPRSKAPLVVNNMLDGESLAALLAAMVNTFVTFPPLGVVLVSMLGLGQVDAAGSDLRADADAARDFARSDPGRLSHRRFLHQHHHAADAVFPAGGGVLPEIRQADRYRHRGRADDSVFGRVFDAVVAVFPRLHQFRTAARPRRELRLPAITSDHHQQPAPSRRCS
jgi:hypothetical protein